jgi:SPP1 gp7 family putative phage head morphogenesis protein
MRKYKTCRAVKPNSGVEARYRKQLDALIKEMGASVAEGVREQYRKDGPEMAQDASPSKLMQQMLKNLGKRWIKRFDDMSAKIADGFANGTFKAHDSAFKAALADAGWTVQFEMTPVTRDILNASISENVALIKSIPQQYLGRVEGIVMRSFVQGRDLSTMSTDLQKEFGVTKRRAALIARDQSNKLTAAATRARRMELGITEAEWLHSHAGKEPRPDHVAADGKRFNIDTGCLISGEYLQPGQLINCRCSSRSILPI